MKTHSILRRGFCTLALLWFVPMALFASKEAPVVGISLDNLVLERWQRDRDIIVATIEKLGGRAIVLDSNGEDALQVSQIKSFIAKSVDVLLVVPHDATALKEAIAAANAAHIPVISYDRLIRESDIAYYLSFDNVKVGEAQATYLAAHLPTGRAANIVRLYGSPSDNNAKLFKKGQDNIIQPLLDSKKINLVYEGWADNWSPEKGAALMTQALEKNLPIDGVLASNDALAGAAYEVLSAAGKDANVIITGQDADLGACARIKQGHQTMTIYKPVAKLAELAAKIAVDIAKGNSPQTTTTINNGTKEVAAIFETSIAVDKDNLASTVMADGFHGKKK